MNFPVLFLIIFLITAFGITAFFYKLTKLNILLSFLAATGSSLLLAGAGHIFSPKIVAQNIGWQMNKYFQFEIGMANILVGVLCISTVFFKHAWLLPAITASTIWGWGNALGHILAYVQEGNKKPGNIGWALYLDIFLPLIAILLYLNLRST